MWWIQSCTGVIPKRKLISRDSETSDEVSETQFHPYRKRYCRGCLPVFSFIDDVPQVSDHPREKFALLAHLLRELFPLRTANAGLRFLWRKISHQDRQMLIRQVWMEVYYRARMVCLIGWPRSAPKKSAEARCFAIIRCYPVEATYVVRLVPYKVVPSKDEELSITKWLLLIVGTFRSGGNFMLMTGREGPFPRS